MSRFFELPNVLRLTKPRSFRAEEDLANIPCGRVVVFPGIQICLVPLPETA